MAPLLNDKVVLVTGGASGLGRAIAKAALEAKAKVCICDVNDVALAEAEKELENWYNIGPLNILSKTNADVTIEASAEHAIEYTLHKFGRLDVLVNCAGVIDGFDPVDTLEKTVWDKVIATNLTGPALMSKHAVKQFLSQKHPGGVIINVGSTSSLKGGFAGQHPSYTPPRTAYTASKHGLIGLTRNSAARYANKKIRCNAILPGPLHTNIYKSFDGVPNEEGLALCQQLLSIPCPSKAEVEKVAKTIVFLSSDNAEPINGAVITADGGATSF
ncbi:short chain dehydrogenase/ reductase [Phyllosticta paracitricarpa]|uniref:Short chain dehydrogenase/ reductase n=1 Tax=Phyllosticta paracitricarpa TaxID=2016321 RepID=A0ABR1NBQ2_9PEZI